MKALAAALLAFVAACGQGKVILNVDVLSFLSASDSTKPYLIPGGVGPIDSTISRRFTMPPGFGNSSVDSVTATVASLLENSTGGGDVILEVFFAQTQGGLFTGTPFLADSSGPVSGVQTVPLGKTTLPLSDPIFNSDSLWVGIRARITTNAGPAMSGQLRFTDIHLRIVLQDNIL
ncbi:MAG TPA: hypothetical protein VEL50_04950 [Gemmatimonadales bacterium]|nr:hypothetical protein [Gemmatimonadales bacterium]